MTQPNQSELDELDKILRRATNQCYADGSRRGSQQSAIEHQAKVAIQALYAPKPVDNGELREKIADIFDDLCEPTNQFWHRESGLYYADKVLALAKLLDKEND